MTAPLPRPGLFRVWITALRPRTLPLSLMPVVAGCVLGWVETGLIRPEVLVAALVTAVAIQIGTNLHNDAMDTLNGTDRADRIGPVRVTQQGWLGPKTVLRAAHLAFVVSLLAGVSLAWLGGWGLLGIGALSIGAGYAYSAGPWPLSRYPFAEAFVTVFFGLVAVGGVVFVYTGQMGLSAGLLGLAIGLPASAVLLVNNTRDMDSDVRAGRKTLSILLGRRGSTRLYRWFLFGALIAACFLAMVSPMYSGAVAALAAFPLVLSNTKAFRDATTGPDFNRCLARTAACQVALTLSLCTGLVIGRIVL